MKQFLCALLVLLLCSASTFAEGSKNHAAQIEALFASGHSLEDVKLQVDAMVDPALVPADVKKSIDELAKLSIDRSTNRAKR